MGHFHTNVMTAILQSNDMLIILLYELCYEKICLQGFQPCPTQTALYTATEDGYRLEFSDLYAKIRFSHNEAQEDAVKYV